MRFRSPPLLIAGFIGAGLSACFDYDTAGERGPLLASFAVAPVLAPGTLSGPAAIDNVRIRVMRPPAEPVLDSTVVFPADSTKLTVRLKVPLKERSEKLLLLVDLRVGTQTLFSASELVEVFAEAQGPTPTPQPVLIYIGPGSTARSIRILPRDTTLSFGDSFTFRVVALDAAGGNVNDLLLIWSLGAAGLAISDAGTIVAPLLRSSAKVRVFTPAGIGDSTSVRFVPRPAVLVPLGGTGQIAPVGSTLGQPFVVQVRGADGLGVPGVAVHFRALTIGGSVQNLTVISDDAGQASTLVTLGNTIGLYLFEASVTGLPVVTITVTATP